MRGNLGGGLWDDRYKRRGFKSGNVKGGGRRRKKKELCCHTIICLEQSGNLFLT